jgi:glucarate dehydratase
MRIDRIESIPVTVPIEAPVLTCFGALSTYSRNVIKIHTDNGLTGYAETSAWVKPEQVRAFEKVILGWSPWEITKLSARIGNWNYYTRTELLAAALEMACLDLQAKSVEIPLYELLGGKVRDKAPVAAYVFFRHANTEGTGEIHDADAVVAFAKQMVDRYGFDTIKLKGGYFSPDEDLESMQALRDAFGPDTKLRIDPQGAWSPATAISIGQKLDEIGLEYYEDPCWGMASMAQVAAHVRSPLATNMCVTSFDHVAPALALKAVDVVLSDLWYWGGIRPTLQLDRLGGTFGLGIGMHSGCELGIGWAAMVHAAVTMPNLKLAIDNMNIHLADDILVGGKLLPSGGEIAPQEGPGLGIEIDETKLQQYHDLATSGAAVDRYLDPKAPDPIRPDWFARMPAW